MRKHRKIKAALLLFGIWMVTGCAAVIIGAGVGAGTYTYIKGELIRSYPAKFDKTLQICIDILDDLNQPIIDKTTDGEKTTIHSKRKDGTDQTIDILNHQLDLTQVSVQNRCRGVLEKRYIPAVSRVYRRKN